MSFRLRSNSNIKFLWNLYLFSLPDPVLECINESITNTISPEILCRKIGGPSEGILAFWTAECTQAVQGAALSRASTRGIGVGVASAISTEKLLRDGQSLFASLTAFCSAEHCNVGVAETISSWLSKIFIRQLTILSHILIRSTSRIHEARHELCVVKHDKSALKDIKRRRLPREAKSATGGEEKFPGSHWGPCSVRWEEKTKRTARVPFQCTLNL